MSDNRYTESARAYHEATAHSSESVRRSGHGMDWAIQPLPFKIYPDLEPIPLPRDFPALAMDAFPALAGAPAGGEPLDLPRLAGLLFFAAGVTKRKTYPGGGEMFFRAAPSTGALYQTEVYVATAAVAGLPAGIYHFSPGDFALRRLREGDFRGVVAGAAADDGVATAPAVVMLSAIYWRNTWKYEARAYRHLFWDSGSMLANLLAAARALSLPARLVTGFVDSEINGLLGVDPDKEGALVVVPVGSDAAPAPAPPVVVPLQHAVIPLSSREVDYPLLRDAYAASCLDSDFEVVDWREARDVAGTAIDRRGDLVGLPVPTEISGKSLGQTILARGSTRQFSGEPITAEALSAALHHATRPIPADVPLGLVDLYLTVHAVEGLAPGAYHYRCDEHALEPLKGGDFRNESAFLCLQQPLGGASSVTVFFLADLALILARFGNRGYRLANLEAGLIGGRLYVTAYAQRFGATGLTFYDAAVAAFFSPHAAGKHALFVTALGRSVRGRPSEPARDSLVVRLGHPPGETL